MELLVQQSKKFVVPALRSDAGRALAPGPSYADYLTDHTHFLCRQKLLLMQAAPQTPTDRPHNSRGRDTRGRGLGDGSSAVGAARGIGRGKRPAPTSRMFPALVNSTQDED